MIRPRFNGAARTFRMTPACPWYPAPPGRKIVERHGSRSRREDERTGHQHALIRFGSPWWKFLFQFFPIRFPLRRCDIPRGFHKLRKLGVCDVVLVDPESIDVHRMCRALVGKTANIVSPHRKFTTGNPYHAFRLVWRLVFL